MIPPMTRRFARHPHLRTTPWIAAGLAVWVLSVAPLPAASSQTWREREKAEFEKGEPKGVSLSADGALRLSPRLDQLFESSQPYLWALAVDPKGTIFASGGNQGRIYRVPAAGKGDVFFRVDEPEVHALALDGAGNLYAGASPGGKIYKVAPDGKKIWVAETGEKYIWALILDRQGELYAGTGLEGRVMKIDAGGRSRILFDSAETHIRSLTLDGEGNLLAGSDGHGLVLRITPKGEGTVLYDAPLNEVVALVALPGGSIYAAVLGEGALRGASRGDRPPSLPAPTPPPAAPSETGPPAPAPPAPPQDSANPPVTEQRVPIGLEGKVFLISRDGFGRELWSGSQEAILSLAPSPGGGLVMGSSLEGRLYALSADGDVGEVARISSGQVTALLRAAPKKGAAADSGDLVVAGSNFGTVSVLRSGHDKSGSFESRVLDARSFADWGRLSFRSERPRGTAVTLQARSGNTEDPDRTWSDWSAVSGAADEARLPSPPARFLQWRSTLTTDDPAQTPVLREVAITYLQRNQPPEIRKVEVQPPGVSFQKIPAVQAGGQEPRPPAASDVDGGGRKRARPQSRRGSDPDARSVTWQVIDPNDDDLIYDVYYKGIDEKTWKQIRKGVDEDFVTLDSTSIPDGTYIVRVVASDAPSNPTGQALTAEKTSAYFDIDNTPPRVEGIKAQTTGSTARLGFTVIDTFSLVREVDYAVDAGDWTLARPADGLNDALQESYELTITGLAPGEHSIVVRATDASGNVGAGKALVQIP